MLYNYVVIEGNIGAGKTSLATRLAGEMNARLILEQFHDNPFLPKFYHDPAQYAFPLELSFLAERYQQLKNTLLEQELFTNFTVSDYIFYKCKIFAGVNLKPDEYSLFSKFFSVMDPLLPSPDLLVYLHTDIPRLTTNIKKRGRDFEKNISEDYLRNVEMGYMSFFKQHPARKTVIIDVTEKDFVNNEADYQAIKKIIQTPFSDGIHRFV